MYKQHPNPLPQNISNKGKILQKRQFPFAKTAEEVQTALPKATPNSERSIVENIVEKLPTMRGKIVKILWTNPSASASSIAKEIGIAQRNVQEHLKQLRAEGIIRRIGPAKGGHWEIITPDD